MATTTTPAPRSSGGPDAQDGLFDQQVTDAGLESALEAREQVRQQRLDVNAAFKQAHTEVLAKLDGLDLDVGQVARVGRFRIAKTATDARSVAFDTAPGERLSITLMDGDD